MKKAVLSFFVLLILVAGLLLAGPMILSSKAVIEKLSQKIEALTGKSVSFDDSIAISYNPYLGVQISNLIVKDENGNDIEPPLLSVENASSQISLISLLMGQVELGELTLERPKLNLRVEPNGFKNWTMEKGQLSSSIKATRENSANTTAIEIPDLALGTLIIKDGIIEYIDMIDDSQETLTSINGQFTWPDITSSSSINANAIWRGEAFELNAEIDKTLSFIAGGETELEFELESQPLQMQFEGIANTLADLFIAGTLQANTPSIQRFAQVFEMDTGELGKIQNWSANGKLEASAKQFNLSEGTFEIGKKTASGVLQFNQMNEASDTKLVGTLAFETIDLPNYPKQLEAKSEIKPFDLDNVDVDLRISAQTLNLGTVSFDNVAASVLASDNEWSFDIGNSNAFEGVMTAKIGQTLEESENRSLLNAKADGVAVEAIIEQFGKSPYSISGTGNIQANLRSTSSNEEPLNYGANGEIEGSIEAGSLVGINLIQLLEKREADEVFSFDGLDENESTDFDTLDFKLFLNNGLGTLARTTLVNGDQTLQLSGEVDFLKGLVNLQAQETKDGIPMPPRIIFNGSLDNLKAELIGQPDVSN